jgi:hypothetical protein
VVAAPNVVDTESNLGLIIFTVLVVVATLLVLPFICFFLCKKSRQVVPDEKISIGDEEASDQAPTRP